jgi:hypothetical protein
MVNNATNINKSPLTSHLSPSLTEKFNRPRHKTFEIQVLAGDRHNMWRGIIIPFVIRPLWLIFLFVCVLSFVHGDTSKIKLIRRPLVHNVSITQLALNTWCKRVHRVGRISRSLYLLTTVSCPNEISLLWLIVACNFSDTITSTFFYYLPFATFINMPIAIPLLFLHGKYFLLINFKRATKINQ